MDEGIHIGTLGTRTVSWLLFRSAMLPGLGALVLGGILLCIGFVLPTGSLNAVSIAGMILFYIGFFSVPVVLLLAAPIFIVFFYRWRKANLVAHRLWRGDVSRWCNTAVLLSSCILAFPIGYFLEHGPATRMLVAGLVTLLVLALFGFLYGYVVQELFWPALERRLATTDTAAS